MSVGVSVEIRIDTHRRLFSGPKKFLYLLSGSSLSGSSSTMAAVPSVHARATFVFV